MKRWIKIALVLIGIGLIAYFVLPVSVPLILAYVTALIFEPLLRWGIRRLKLKRKWMVILTFTTFMIVLLGMTYWFVSRGIAQLIHFAERIPHYTWSFIRHWEQFTESIISMAEELPAPMVEELNSQLDGFLFSITEPLRTFDYLKLATTIGTSLPVFLVSVLVYLIAFFLFMLEMPKLIESFYSHLKQDTAEKFRFMSERFSSVFWGFFKAQFLISLIVFAVSLIWLLFFFPAKFAIIMSLIIWFIDFVPIIGSIVITAPWAFVELIQGNTYACVAVLVLAAILLIIRRTLEPKVMGEYIGLSPLATLISMFIGVKLIGVAGFFLGPLLLIAYGAAKEAKLIQFDFKI
jgi:sporulation integral membrane protein YtvI